MQLKNEQEFEAWKKSHNHFYIRNVLKYAEKWADLMEKALSKGKTIPEVAERLSHEADTDSLSGGITGAQYHGAIELLSSCWLHGETLQQWHDEKRRAITGR